MPPKKAAKNKTVLPDPLPLGEVLTDITKKKWCLGPSIGVGGFGEIYSAVEHNTDKKSSNYQYVIKIEPHGNGPLFCEMHFFMRNAKPDMIQSWCSTKKLSVLGMPRYLGSGSHEHNGKKYRFLVMDKYGKDLWHIFLQNNRQFPEQTVYRMAIQILEVLEYIHSNGYVHADIKGANILAGLAKSVQNQVFLVDFGLASHYTKKDFKPDPKKAHNGTIEYTSRDAHDGVPTRRGDLEILAYNMIQWLGGTFPWEKLLSDPIAVHSSKKEHMNNIKKFINTCFKHTDAHHALQKFLNYITTLKFDTEPDYKQIRAIFMTGLKSSGGSLTGTLKLQMTPAKHKLEKQKTSDTPEKKLRLNGDNVKRTPQTKRTRRPSSEENEFEAEDAPVKTKSKTRKNVKEDDGNMKGTPKTKRTRRPVRSPNLQENESEEEEEEEDTPARKTRSRFRKIIHYNEKANSDDDNDEGDNVQVKPHTKRTRRDQRTYSEENVSENELEVVKIASSTQAKNKNDGKLNGGYTAEMLRIQKKIEEKNVLKTRNVTKKVTKTKDDTVTKEELDIDDVDIIEGTPEEIINGDRKRNVKRNKTSNNLKAKN